MRICNTCKVKKEYSEYYTRHDTFYGITGACKQCMKERTKLWYKANKI